MTTVTYNMLVSEMMQSLVMQLGRVHGFDGRAAVASMELKSKKTESEKALEKEVRSLKTELKKAQKAVSKAETKASKAEAKLEALKVKTAEREAKLKSDLLAKAEASKSKKAAKAAEREAAKAAKAAEREAAKAAKAEEREAAKAAKAAEREAAKIEKQRLKQLEKLSKVVDGDESYLKEIGASEMTIEELKAQIVGEKKGRKEEAKRQKVIAELNELADVTGAEFGSMDGFELGQLKTMLKEQKALARKAKKSPKAKKSVDGGASDCSVEDLAQKKAVRDQQVNDIIAAINSSDGEVSTDEFSD